MSDNVKGVIEATKAQIREIIQLTAVGYHERVYVNLDDGRVRFLAGTPGGTVVAYTDFVEGEIDRLEGDDLEAIIPVPEVLDHLSLTDVGTSGTLELEFIQSEDAALAEQLRISPGGAHSFDIGITLPASESQMENVPTTLPNLFSDDNVLLNQQEEREVHTRIDTYVESLDQVIEVVDLREELEFYPIVVEDGQFLIDVGSDTGNYTYYELQGDVQGNLDDEDPHDVDNLYGSGFKEITNAVEGQLTLHLEQDSPMLILKELSYGTLRHVIGAAQ